MTLTLSISSQVKTSYVFGILETRSSICSWTLCLRLSFSSAVGSANCGVPSGGGALMLTVGAGEDLSSAGAKSFFLAAVKYT